MSTLLKLVLFGSLVLNLIAIWGLFYYTAHGGSPLSDIKRKLTGTFKQTLQSKPFSEENTKIKDLVYKGETDSLRVVFYGASITHSWDLDKYFGKIHPVNRGVGGFVDELVIEYKNNVLDLKPKAVVLKLCSINLRPEIPMNHLMDGMSMMVEMAESNNIIPIVATIIPPGKPSARIGDFSVIDSLKSFNDWVREYAVLKSIPIVDYAGAIGDSEGFLPRDCAIDPVHINEKGYEIVSEAAIPVVYKALGLDQ